MINSLATSVTSLTPHLSPIVACYDLWREICHPAFSDFCNTIGTELPIRNVRSFRQRAGLFDPDGGKAARRDAQRQRSSIIITPPDRQHATSGDFLDQSIGQELADRFLDGAALGVLGDIKGAIFALRLPRAGVQSRVAAVGPSPNVR